MSPTSPVAEQNLRFILTEESAAASEKLVLLAEETARSLVEGRGAGGEAGKTQIRAIFDELRQIEALWLSNPERALSRLHLLKPKLAYRTARAQGVTPLTALLTPAVGIVTQSSNPDQAKTRFTRLVELCEAILAYYTAETSKPGETSRGGRR